MFIFTVRPAGFGDFSAIYNLSVKKLGSELDSEVMEKAYRNILTDSEQIILAAVHSGRIVGYIHARQVNNLYEEVHTEVAAYAMYDYYRENGADRSLLGALEKWSIQMTSRKMIIGSNARYPEAEIYLLENGFRKLASGSFEKILF